MTRQDAVAGIAATVTYQGLKCTAVLDDGHYRGKVKISDKRMRYLEERVLARGSFHGEWNYAVRPAAPSRRRSVAWIWRLWPLWQASRISSRCWPPPPRSGRRTGNAAWLWLAAAPHATGTAAPPASST